jgi:penicillin-binding protein 1A
MELYLEKYYLQDRVNVEYKDIAKPVIDALVATEDERFYEHSGIDLRSIGRAVAGLGRDGGVSTISMQTAKNLFTENWATRNFWFVEFKNLKKPLLLLSLNEILPKMKL